MTKEEAITIIDNLHLIGCGRNQHEDDLRINVALDLAIEAIRHDVIFEQIKWERDVALQTLEEHGIGLGQKCDAEVVSADAVQGEWIFNPTDAIDLMFAKPKCSRCGFESSDGGNYCSNCGAKMKGGAE